MANNRLSAALAAAVLVGCCSVGAFAEAASPDSASEPAVSAAASEPAVSGETASPPDLSDSALDNATTYTPAEITEILKDHPNAFTTAADPASSSATEETGSADSDQQQSTEPGTIWLKPFNSYTPAEGYLLLLTVIALSGAAFKLIKYLWL